MKHLNLMRHMGMTLGVVLAIFCAPDSKAGLFYVDEVSAQPLEAQVKRLVQAMEFLGSPFGEGDVAELERLSRLTDEATIVSGIQKVLDPYCLAGINVNPESRVKVSVGMAMPVLVKGGWRSFLLKVHNEAGVTSELRVESPQGIRLAGSPAESIRDRWMEVSPFNQQPLSKNLSGLALEYRIVSIYSRDEGPREAKLSFNVGQGTQDLGFRNEIDVLFQCEPSLEVVFGIRDEAGEPTTGTLEIRDRQGRVYPSQAKRLAPDFSFHPQIYRADGETLDLPAGWYHVKFSRGPESIPEEKEVVISEQQRRIEFKVKRWIDPSKMGWWSGDHHIHAAGCAHYTNPSEGVHAVDMMRHCLGEDLKVGANLTWGPCFDYQKQFFTGLVDKVSQYPYLLRYDIEVSGFGSHQSGHLCLLRLEEQIYPGGDSKDHWPKLCLNTLRWAKRQGAVVGPAHSGWGLEVESADLPNYIIPPFNGIGANEYIVDVTHEIPGKDGKLERAVDFISTVDTPYVWELNIWYHTLNAGFRTRISGETDFPCIYGERVGLGRSYVKLDGKLDYDAWCEGIRQGRNYVGDGNSHLIDFQINGVKMGEKGSELKLKQPGSVTLSVKAAAFLKDIPDNELRSRPYQQKPYWHLERARIEGTKEVPVEVIVNGYPVAKQTMLADGQIRDLEFQIPLVKSSWVAVRILPSSHTNPIFVEIGGKPIRASRKSLEWCLKSVEQCRAQKARFMPEEEKEDFKIAYDHALSVYRQRLSECED